jgi:hypothetical protein
MTLVIAACGSSHPSARKAAPKAHPKGAPVRHASLPPVAKLAPAPAAAAKVLFSLKGIPSDWRSKAPTSHDALSGAKNMEVLASCLHVPAPTTLPAVSDAYSFSLGGQVASSTTPNVKPSESMQAEVWIWPSDALASRFFKALHSPVAAGCLTKASEGGTSVSSSSPISLALRKAPVTGLDAPAVAFSLTYGGSLPKVFKTTGTSTSPAPFTTLPISLPKIHFRVIYLSLGKVLIASDWAAIQLPFPSSVELTTLRSMISAAKLVK